MGLGGLYDNVSRGLSNAKQFLGRAYHGGVKFAQGLDQYAGVARNVIGAVAPMVGSMSGPMGSALGAAVGGGMKALGGLRPPEDGYDEPDKPDGQRRVCRKARSR